MNYLIYGTNDYLINDYISKLIKKEHIDKFNISQYDLTTNIKDIIEDANTISMFSSKKMIVLSINILNDNKDIDIDILEQYLENPNPDTILVLVSNEDIFDTRASVYKIIKNNGIIANFKGNINPYDFIKKSFKDYKIADATIKLIINRVGNDLKYLSNEIEKLKLYKMDDKIISDNDVLNATVENIDTNIFKFIDDIINKNKKEALKKYHELLNAGEEPLKIIIMLANQFRLMYQCKSLYNKKYSEDDIAKELNVKKYPVHLAINKSYKYSNNVLLEHLKKLAELDIQIKTSSIDKKLALELFILEL